MMLSIGALARRTGCTVPTIRYYEEIGLLPPAPRTEGGQRQYGDAALHRLAFVRRCRQFAFTIDQVRELVSLVDAPHKPCVDVRDVAAARLREVRQKLVELQELEASLAGFVDSCNAGCAGGAVADCTILEDLAPSQVQAPRPGRCCAG